tara:strand:- start:2194 stop:3009 length:816 start_codon:yes stop_codon:yes gene_type:complete
MSYILDSLKKLEKEKSKFDHRFDIKKLVLKDDSETTTVKILKRRSQLLTLLALATSIFLFLIFFVFELPPPSFNIPMSLSTPPVISNQAKLSQDLDLVPKNNDSALSAIKPFPVPVVELDRKTDLLSKEIKTKKEENETTGTVQIPQDLSDGDLKQRLDHIEQLIQKEYIPAELNKLTESEIEDENPSDNFPSKTVSRTVLPQDIVDLEVSGIVFFGEGASLNYAIASYKGKSQIKLKEGDSLDGIEVSKILPEKILLIFEDKVFEKKLGN